MADMVRLKRGVFLTQLDFAQYTEAVDGREEASWTQNNLLHALGHTASKFVRTGQREVCEYIHFLSLNGLSLSMCDFYSIYISQVQPAENGTVQRQVPFGGIKFVEKAVGKKPVRLELAVIVDLIRKKLRMMFLC